MAGFNTAVTGLKSASQMLDVAGNNIANSSTVGFKSSRTEFSDIYATSVVGAGASNQPGSGVTVSDISQDFSAGTIEFTNNNLDLAINGSGFFQLNDGQGGITYTRAGAFELDKDGYIVTKTGKFLQGYGLDSEGNALPIQNLAVTQKESPPSATQEMSLSVNIDATDDAETLARTFEKSNPASYTYSTTVETVDSLGNSNSIRFYYVEQAAVREQYSYTFSGAPTEVSLSTVVLSAADLAALGTDVDVLNEIEEADPRIDVESLSWNGNTLSFEFKSESTQTGEVYINGIVGGVSEVPDWTPTFPKERAANEVQEIPLNDPAVETSLQTGFNVLIGGVELSPSQSFQTIDDLGEYIQSQQSRILDANPTIESVTYDGTANIVVKFKAEAGAQSDVIEISGSDASVLFADSNADGEINRNDMEITAGDNSYLGTYRMYAYLNDDIALDIGKLTDKGQPGGAITETGPILVQFDPTSGQLSNVNREDARGAIAPLIEISGADPANPNGESVITLDITGSSQFASESIVKAAAQDGYPKGDLIGVSFAETGEMVASFSNGQRQNLGLVAIASFENQAGLRSSGSTEWIATLNSGSAILNPPGTGLNGTLRSAALESSNVDLSAELVKLIEAQRNFQANSKTLETQNTVTQAILQI